MLFAFQLLSYTGMDVETKTKTLPILPFVRGHNWTIFGFNSNTDLMQFEECRCCIIISCNSGARLEKVINSDRNNYYFTYSLDLYEVGTNCNSINSHYFHHSSYNGIPNSIECFNRYWIQHHVI